MFNYIIQREMATNSSTLEAYPEAKQAAEERLASLKAKNKRKKKTMYINIQPNDEPLELWYDATKQEDSEAPDKFAVPTDDNPTPMRDIVVFTVKKRNDNEDYTISLTPSNAEIINRLLARRGGCAWIETSKFKQDNGFTKWDFQIV